MLADFQICMIQDNMCTVSSDSRKMENGSSNQKDFPAENENEDCENFFEEKCLIQSQQMYVVLPYFSAQWNEYNIKSTKTR